MIWTEKLQLHKQKILQLRQQTKNTQLSPKKTYEINRAKVPSKTNFDIVIVAHSKDKTSLLLLLKSIKMYVRGVNNIYLIAKENFVGTDVIFVNEENFMFKKENVVNILTEIGCPIYKHGWYYQQLLKFYSYTSIPGLTEYFLILDADIIFINLVNFFHDDVPYLTMGSGYHEPYFEHMNRLLPDLTRQTEYGGICHHMIFKKSILNSLFAKVEKIHNMPFWRAFLSCLNFKNAKSFCCASEYEIYFNYVFKFYHNFYELRQLKWDDSYDNDENIYKKKKSGHVFVCRHDYNVHGDKENVIE